MAAQQQQTIKKVMILFLAACSGMITGLGEALLLGVQKILLQRAVFFGPRVVWMAAVADLLLFTVIGLLLLLLSCRWPKLRSVRAAVSLFTFLALSSWLLIFPQIKWYASLILAAGLAAQAGPIAAARTAGRSLAAPIKLLPLAALMLLVVALEGGRWWQQHQAMISLPAPQTAAPNVLLIVLDTVRAQNLSLYGYHRATTPRLEQFARRGVRFGKAITTAPWTLPAHASIFTGRYPRELSADFLKPLDASHPTLAEVLRARGYLTAGFVANTFYCGYEHGLSRGFLHYEDYQLSLEELLISSSLLRTTTHNAHLRRIIGNHQILTRKTAAQVNENFLSWLSDVAATSRRPFFAFLNYFDAHEPYLPPAPYDTLFGANLAWRNWPHDHAVRAAWRIKREQMNPQQNQAAIDAYDGSIAYLDHHLGLLFDELERRGLLEQTIVIVTSDHGEAFGEHGYHGHGDNLYLPLLHVPLLISFPARVPAGREIQEPVTLRDLAATILDLAGINQGNLLPGHSLARHWIGTSAVNASTGSPVLSELNIAPIRPRLYPPGSRAEMYSLLSGRYHYIRNASGQEEVYDIVNDPSELHNLADSEEGRQMSATFRKFLNQMSEE